MKVIETPAQKRKRLLMQKAWKIYKENEGNKSVVRLISEVLGMSENTIRNWINKLKKEYEQ